MPSEDYSIRNKRRAGDDALIVELHRRGYETEGDRFREDFCTYVAATVAEADLNDPAHGRVWFVERGDRAVGCAAMVHRGDRAQLRWVVLTAEARGAGLGRALVERAIAYAHAKRYREVFLETTDGLGSSMAIYEKLGFLTVHDASAPLWHGDGRLIVMTLDLRVQDRQVTPGD